MWAGAFQPQTSLPQLSSPLQFSSVPFPFLINCLCFYHPPCVPGPLLCFRTKRLKLSADVLWTLSTPTTIFLIGWSDFLISLDCQQNNIEWYTSKSSTDTLLKAQIITNRGGLNKNGCYGFIYLNAWSLGSGTT